ncbi:uncharacterized protein DUF4129 [Sediminihabitans luteus]|uniref:Uncharacterized protein DUF4129 n=1 Tax=Sediminihabitans luteus TaxID=1138585 RepID=A0A2M9CDS7_9CELL|nr:DUF4129 domain-containing protein [Sediminihabitans luteus]PJJ70015.1 uncharacterized protein DUF4129 [Sediminihabitans luteus]GII99336.1 hypothetical protein Slu03_17140 [Sediminihabitans luteus]
MLAAGGSAFGAGAGVVARVLADVPVDPDAPTARTWAREELAQPQYAHGESILDRLIAWFQGLFDGVGAAPALSTPSVVLLVAILVTVLVVAFALAGRVRRTARTRRSAAVLADDDRTSADLRRAADDAAARGDWDTAVLERFRAVVRALEERTVLDERPGRTAHEVGLETPRRLDVPPGTLDAACALFDEVCYGERPASAHDDALVREVDARLADARRRRAVERAEVDA